MFTGIITDVGTVADMRPAASGRDTRLTIATAWDTTAIALGASVAINGCCLTVVERLPGALVFEASAETLALTTLGAWLKGQRVNLERALRMGDELGGHIVSGHVDGVGRALSATPEGGSARWIFEVPTRLARFIAAKGSVAVDGVSLTVNHVEGARFGVNIIAHTARATNFSAMQPGDTVNIEIDMLARYVARLAEAQATGNAA